MSKKYKGKACVYCGRQGVSTTADHVLAREFFLISDRANLPIVPACEECNYGKSLLEQYALTVLPMGNRHLDAHIYSQQNIARRLRKNQALWTNLSLEHLGLWEQGSNNILLPVMSIGIDSEKIQELFAFVVRGLFTYHWDIPLHPKWYPDVAIIRTEAEHEVFSTILTKMGQRVSVTGNLGRGTLIYWGTRSLSPFWWSLWQFTLFEGLRFGNSNLGSVNFTRLSAVTRPDMTLGPFTQEEAGFSGEGFVA